MVDAIMGAVHGLVGLGPAGYAVGAAGSAVGVGFGLFNYNRGNFKFDQKLHFARFQAGQNYAIAQVKQYREDLVDLSTLTSNRMDQFHSVAAMALTILTALFCPGRLGLHTPAPPGWLMGLFMVNLGGCYLWLGLTMWLAMHASMRADTAATHMLTRFTRLPIPNTKMIDRARKFMANYEEISLREVLRFPFLQSHPSRGPDNKGDNVEGTEIDPDALRRMRHGYDVPAWYCKEKKVDQKLQEMESMMPYKTKGNVPEHFEAYREIQNEWWPYDVYARISIFLAHMHLFHAWTYQQIGHGFQETRALWAVGTVVFPLSALQQMLLILDVVPKHGELPLEKLGPCAQLFAYLACYIDYMRWFSTEAQWIGFLLVYAAYIIHIVYTVQLLRLCQPSYDKAPQPNDAAGAAWWPGTWTLPAAFSHAVWLVAPPRELEPGQTDLAGEMREAGKHSGPEYMSQAKLVDAEKRQDVHKALGPRGESPAWRNVQVGLLALLVAWIWSTVGFTVEVITQGTTHPSFLSAPGLPHMTRHPAWRVPKPGREHPVEVGTGGMSIGPLAGERHGHGGEGAEHGEAGGHDAGAHGAAAGAASGGHDTHAAGAGGAHGGAHRRLAEEQQEVSDRVRAVLPLLRELSRGASLADFAGSSAGRSAGRFEKEDRAVVSLPSSRVAVQWPPLFEPRLLACSHAGPGRSTLLLSRHGRGMIVESTIERSTPSLNFALEGVSSVGPLHSASWDENGLLLTTTAGAVLECPGFGPSSGRWRCSLIPGAMLPLGLNGGKHFSGSVALARSVSAESNALRAAVYFPDEESLVFYSRAHGQTDAPWLPSGEIRIRGHGDMASMAYAVDGSLILSSRGGAVLRLHTSTGSLSSLASAGKEGNGWHGACGMHSGHIARLAHSPPMGSADVREPNLFVSSMAA
eukprot:TRINITY_DN5075_c1_g2_i1.p1 TRINITY_DN5075_c1_g2~~TRINITY_DN5075_c1_g2_i1.p1  ORF type:complete len:916 (-),score=184.39 TRINITY_DN5075_c1_g2_i1:214-2961(-)